MDILRGFARVSWSKCDIFQAATGLADGTLKVNRERTGMKKVMKMVLEDNPFGRNFVFNKGAGLPLHPPSKLPPIIGLTTCSSTQLVNPS